MENYDFFAICNLNKKITASFLQNRPRQTSSKLVRQLSPRGMRDHGCRRQRDFYWPSPLQRSLHPSKSFVLITHVMKDSMCFQTFSDRSMRGIVVSGVSSELIAPPTASLATFHPSQTKSVRSASSTGESQ